MSGCWAAGPMRGKEGSCMKPGVGIEVETGLVRERISQVEQ